MLGNKMLNSDFEEKSILKTKNMDTSKKEMDCCENCTHAYDPLTRICVECYENDIKELKGIMKQFLEAYSKVCMTRDTSEQLKVSEEIIDSIHRMRLAVYGDQRNVDDKKIVCVKGEYCAKKIV